MASFVPVPRGSRDHGEESVYTLHTFSMIDHRHPMQLHPSIYPLRECRWIGPVKAIGRDDVGATPDPVCLLKSRCRSCLSINDTSAWHKPWTYSFPGPERFMKISTEHESALNGPITGRWRTSTTSSTGHCCRRLRASTVAQAVLYWPSAN